MVKSSDKIDLFGRLLLIAAAAVFAAGGILHALAFATHARRVIDTAALPPFFASELKFLWLADSTTLVSLGTLFALLGFAERESNGVLILAFLLVPVSTTGLLYIFLGGFYAAHLLAVASALAFVAGCLRIRAERIANND